MRDEPLALFAAATAREAESVQEIDEPVVALQPMTAGKEVVEDYRHVGLTLRQHPVSFLRADLTTRRIVSCTEAMQARDGARLETSGLVLVRQRPGSAKGVLFITLEDETGIANLVVWPTVFEQFRRVVMRASMIAVGGRVQREGEVVHLVANRFVDLSAGARHGRQPRRGVPTSARSRRPGNTCWRTRRARAAADQSIPCARHLHSRSAHRHDPREKPELSLI